MNKSESKYFNTAEKMDEAFLDLLAKKDLEYITVKEICAKAGVNRSTFYLHYEKIDNLLKESYDYVIRRFLSYYSATSAEFMQKIKQAELSELYLITPEYVIPYLRFIKEYQKLFRFIITKSEVFDFKGKFTQLCDHIFFPILEKYRVPSNNRSYCLSFYIGGIMAVITEWLSKDCTDSIDFVADFILKSIPHSPKERFDESDNL